MMKKFLIIIFVFSYFFCAAQKNFPASFSLPLGFCKTDKWMREDYKRNSINQVDSQIQARATIESGHQAKELPFTFYLQEFESTNSFENYCYTKKVLILNYAKAFPTLVGLLVDTANSKLILSCDTNSYKPLSIKFTKAQRASNLLNELTGEHFVEIGSDFSRRELISAQRKWVSWIKNLRVGNCE